MKNNITRNLTSMEKNGLVSIIIPVLNEETSIRKILDILKTEFNEKYKIIVVDGGSTDGTVEIVLEKGVQLIKQKSKGHENAVIEGILNSKGKYVVIIDADMTYDPSDINKMLSPLFEHDADFVIGKRYNPNIKKVNRPLLNSLGHSIIKNLFNFLFDTSLSDPASQFRAIKIIDKSVFNKNDFNNVYETTVILKGNNYRIKEIPIKYYERIGVSKIHPISVGFNLIFTMLKTWYKLKFGEKNE